MATKTLILRPTASFASSNVVRYPETTADEDIYLLAAEEVADDSATYFESSGITPYVFISFSIPVEYTTQQPTSIRATVRMRTEIDSTAVANTYIAMISGNDATNAEFMDIGDVIKTPNSYNTYTQAVSSEYIENIWNMLLIPAPNENFNGHLAIRTITDNGKGGLDVFVTQVYLEIDFEVEPTSIFIKRNNNFIEATKAYQKISGTWTEITAEECKTLIQSANEGG